MKSITWKKQRQHL